MPRLSPAALALLLSACAARAPVRDQSPAAPLRAATEAAPLPKADPADGAVLIPSAKRPAVPGFTGATSWLNVDHPLTIAELRGRVVVVDFWTSCCINCLHTLPKLRLLEQRFSGDALTVVGVHAPKFDEERTPERLRDILLAESIEHPVALDGDMAIWNAWGVEGWPTLAVLDVDGRVVWASSGEPDIDALAATVGATLEEARRAGRLAKGPLRGLRPERDRGGALRYPGKVIALSDGGYAIADTGHNRVVVVDAGAHATAVVGSGEAGRDDGDFTHASFRRPEGIAEIGEALYVADTENHLLRKIDRRAKLVSTVAGTGALGSRPLSVDEVAADHVALRSPWDLLARKGSLYVALAGSHQIAVFDPSRATIRAFAGDGAEARRDGGAHEASFAQPSGLATDDRELFVLDSETSSLRAIAFADGKVRTIVGQDLFVFGDVDGSRTTARLQHPIGLAYGRGALWIADSYNSKIKRVDPATGATRTIAGGGDALGEPAGLTIAGDALVVADTNHHRLVRLPFGSSARAPEPIALSGLAAPARRSTAATPQAVVRIDPRDPVVNLGPLAIAAGAPTRVHVDWGVPAGTAVNPDAPFHLLWAESSGLAKPLEPLRVRGADVAGGFDVAIEPATTKLATATGVLEMVVCDAEHHRVCVPVRRTIKASFAPSSSGAPIPPRARIDLPAAR